MPTGAPNIPNVRQGDAITARRENEQREHTRRLFRGAGRYTFIGGKGILSRRVPQDDTVAVFLIILNDAIFEPIPGDPSPGDYTNRFRYGWQEATIEGDFLVLVEGGDSGTPQLGYALNLKERLVLEEPATDIDYYIPNGVNVHGSAYQAAGLRPRQVGGGGIDFTWKQPVCVQAWRASDGRVWFDEVLSHDGECSQ